MPHFLEDSMSNISEASNHIEMKNSPTYELTRAKVDNFRKFNELVYK